ncbi:MAG: epimerase [Boseongicola sp.]|nr:epimerase [Boseongicola sp.]
MSGRVLILGASGRFGRNAAEAFWNHGWTVKIFDRERDDLNELAKDADVIVNAWNPPYPDWAAQVPRLTAQVIEAAKVNDATVIIPGNVYVYGHDNGVVWSNETPHLATNPLGRIRIEMEAAYRDAGVKTIILRAGDYIDSEASGNWFDKVITKKVQKGTFSAPGPMNVPHAWSWLPDVARAAVQLADRRHEIGHFEEVLFPGYTLSLAELKDLVERATGQKQKTSRVPWWAFRLASPFWPMGKHLIEMSYLWRIPHQLDGEKFAQLLPKFRPTDPLTAIATALHTDVDPNQSVPRSLDHIPAE